MKKYIYHYSQNFHEILQSPLKCGQVSDEDLEQSETDYKRYNQVGKSVDGILFLFQPLPSKLLGHLNGGEHPIWTRGKHFFEYKVEVKNIGNCSFNCHGTAIEKKFAQEFMYEHRWDGSDDIILTKKYLVGLRQRQEYQNDIGYSVNSLDRIHGRHDDLWLDFHNQSSQHMPDCTKYTVPCVNVFATSGNIEYSSVHSLIIGSDKRINIDA